MRKANCIFFIKESNRKIILILFNLLVTVDLCAQTCDPLTFPQLFGQSLTSIFCQNNTIGFGVSNSTSDQSYYFSVYKNGIETSRKAGPLEGNGSQLSISTFMRSAQDAGEYRVTTKNKCGAMASTNFEVFYSNIDNLSITSWGSNAVSFKWVASGPVPAVTYDYAVTTEPDPNSSFISLAQTTDTTASQTQLTPGVTYYIYVRVNSAIWNNQNVNQYFDCPGGDLPWQTLQFIPCSGTASVGTITPVNAIACTGSTVNLKATGGNTYKWYQDNNTIPITGANSSTYAASNPAEYKVYVTTTAGCEGMVASATVTQTSVQTGEFTGGGGCYNIGDSVKLGIRKTVIGQTYKILKDGAEVINFPGIGSAFESADSILYSFKLISASQYGHYTVRTSNAYCNAVDFGDQTISGPGLWTGASDTNWQNSANWSCGGVPDANTSVVISTGATHMPHINNNVSCKSITVQQGATLTVSSGFKLSVTGK